MGGTDSQCVPPFRFFDLPTEIRTQIFDHLLVLEETVDSRVKVHEVLSNTFLVSKRFYKEAMQAFYGRNLFRILPTHPQAQNPDARPLLEDFSQCHRSCIVSMELHLGKFSLATPKCWKITDGLGLEEAVLVRMLRVFIEHDPLLAIFNGFKNVGPAYAELCVKLLQGCIDRLPNLEEIRFDAFYNFSRGAPLMDRLVEQAHVNGKRVSWGPFQRAIDRDRAERNLGAVEQSPEMLRVGMIPFYGSSPVHRQNIPKILLG